MRLFGQIIRTAINVATLPIAVVKDVVTLGGVARYPKGSYVVENLRKIKEESE